MTLFLRTENNITLLDVEYWIKSEGGEGFLELRCVIPIKAYSEFLLENLSRGEEIIEAFAELQELRGWLWEVHFMGRQNNTDEYRDVLLKLRGILTNVAKEFDLALIED